MVPIQKISFSNKSNNKKSAGCGVIINVVTVFICTLKNALRRKNHSASGRKWDKMALLGAEYRVFYRPAKCEL
jgi:hypothetical protein